MLAALATAYRQSHKTQPHRYLRMVIKYIFVKVAVSVWIHFVLDYDLERYSRSIIFGDTISLARFHVTKYRMVSAYVAASVSGAVSSLLFAYSARNAVGHIPKQV